MNKEFHEQYKVVKEDENSGEKYLVWNNNKRYFKTLKEAEEKLEEDKREMRENRPIKLADGIYATIEESTKSKYKWTIKKRYVTDWEEV